MKDISSKTLLLVVDCMIIGLSLWIGYEIRMMFDNVFSITFEHHISQYVEAPFMYLFIVSLFAYEGIYTKRYDFWQESRQIIKALGLSFILTMAFFAISKSIDSYSRAVIVFSFMCMALFIPLFKIFVKKFLYAIGLWKREAAVYSNDPFVTKEIFENHYLGYIKSDTPKTVFVNSDNTNAKTLYEIIERETRKTNEVIFIPLIGEFDLTQSAIYQLSQTRTNLIVYKNHLKSRYRAIIHIGFNYFLAIVFLPLLLLMIGVIALCIKRESKGPVFFTHKRVGKNGKTIPILKFRSMYQDAEERLETLLKNDSKAQDEWNKNFKLKVDPRVTKVGMFLRKTSLDELPQIFNVLKGEMNFVGPRPVIQQEIDQYYKEDAEYYFMVKPGITGLWQVSGRSDTDYDFRISTDKWYVTNWSLWLDIVILLKTIKTVLKKEGAY